MKSHLIRKKRFRSIDGYVAPLSVQLGINGRAWYNLKTARILITALKFYRF